MKVGRSCDLRPSRRSALPIMSAIVRSSADHNAGLALRTICRAERSGSRRSCRRRQCVVTLARASSRLSLDAADSQRGVRRLAVQPAPYKRCTVRAGLVLSFSEPVGPSACIRVRLPPVSGPTDGLSTPSRPSRHTRSTGGSPTRTRDYAGLRALTRAGVSPRRAKQGIAAAAVHATEWLTRVSANRLRPVGRRRSHRRGSQRDCAPTLAERVWDLLPTSTAAVVFRPAGGPSRAPATTVQPRLQWKATRSNLRYTVLATFDRISLSPRTAVWLHASEGPVSRRPTV